MASITTFPPVSGVDTGTAYDDTAIAARVKGLEDAGFITADDLPEISEAEWSGISGNIADQEDLATALKAKQDTLVSGTNIKTINGETVLGEGDIIIESGGLDEAQLEAFLIGLEDGTLSGDEYVVMVNREQDVVTRYSLNDLISTIASLVDVSGGDSGLDFEDRQKIDSIEFEATKNQSDGYLLNRANHTGTIQMSVVENLDQALANIELGGMTAGETLRVDGIEDSLALKADLDGSGKLLASQLPDIASGRKIKVADAAARLLVDAHPDLTIAYQTDDGTSWAINGGDAPSNPDNWTELGSALISGVTSYNTRTGNIMPQAGDYTAEMVTESDLKQFVTAADKVSWNNRVPDAPFNGQIYGRKNGEWIIVTGGSGGSGSLSPQKEEELLERSNHTGTQGMETIDGLADTFNTKADINTVYAEPMQTSYTIRTVDSTENQVHTFLLNGTNNSFGIHAYALRMTPSTADSYSLITTIQPGGYYGVKIPRVNGITIESTGQGNEPHVRMTRHVEHGQTVTATSEYSASYAVCKMFQAGDTPLSESDNWCSSRLATPTDPQIITLTLPNAVKLNSYGMVPYNTRSPRTWTFEGRLGDESDWNILHTVTDEASALRRDYTIPTSNQGMYDQYRWVITGSNGNGYFYIGRIFLYTAPAKFMIKDGDTFYDVSSAALTNIYEPMTTLQQHEQTAFGSTRYSTSYDYWKVFQAGYAASTTDHWRSSKVPTIADPQYVGIDLGVTKLISKYELQNSMGTTNVNSPKSWAIQVRNSLLDEWETIHTVLNDTRGGSGETRMFTIPKINQGEWRYVQIVINDRNGTQGYVLLSRFKLYSVIGEELTPISGVVGTSGITVNGTDDKVNISQEVMETLSEPYIVTDEPYRVNFSIDPESEYEYANDTKITLANSYIRFSPTVAGYYKFCYQEPTN